MSPRDPSMEDLPVEFMVDILSRLPVKTIIHCKCVCKKWLKIILDSYFADLHFLRSPTSVMIHHNSEMETTGYHNPGILRWIEVEDEFNDPVMSIDLNLASCFQDFEIHLVGSVNGLICLWQCDPNSYYPSTTDNTYICNPITREYMILPLPRQQLIYRHYANVVYCFGVSSLTREYKVIRIFQTHVLSQTSISATNSIIASRWVSQVKAEVYTLGTGQWRSLGHVPYRLKGLYGPFLNGHAHWTIVDKDSPEKIFSFDFDKETFELFPSPPFGTRNGSLGVLKGCLCLCDTYESKFTVWVMKEYGIKKSWHKEVVFERNITRNPHLLALDVCIIDGPKDEAVLMAPYKNKQLAFCLEGKTIVDMEIFDVSFKAFAYNPSFHRLHSFEKERVHVHVF